MLRETVPDSAEGTHAALERALRAADVLIASGGVSVGPHDPREGAALRELGVEERFWGALRPGKPTWFGTREDTLVFGLPGNPVSAMVTFHLFVAPALAGLQADPSPGASPRRSTSRWRATRAGSRPCACGATPRIASTHSPPASRARTCSARCSRPAGWRW